MADSATLESHAFQAETSELLNLVINSLYTKKEVFLRELVSNASDALDKARIKSLTDHDLLGEDTELEIEISTDAEAGTVTISDNGIGMSKEELTSNLGTIAKSGSKEFAKALGEASKDANLIGQFGVGFYSAFLVADEVKVTSRAAKSDEAWTWSSQAKGEFSIQAGERASRGTSIVLHLKDEQKEYADGYRLSNLIKRYSDFVGYPVKLERTETTGEGDEAETTTTSETVNKAKALWTRSKDDISDEQYEEFYKHVSHDWEPPLARSHFTIEGSQLFTGLLFLPKRAPFDLHMRDSASGIKLHVKRVFVMDDCDALLPEYLRFVRGVVDSDDLPLNVSREVLQQDKLVGQIKKQVTKKVLAMVEDLAKEKPEDYLGFWGDFGKVMKEGIHSDFANKDRIAGLLRYASSTQDTPTSLADYVSRMPEGQESIYFISGPDADFLANSPHIEGLKAKAYEVLFFTDPVDEWVSSSLTEFEGKKLLSATKGEIELDEKSEEEAKERDETFGTLLATTKEILGERVEGIRMSDRLTDSPVCLVSGENAAGANMERILAAAGAGAGIPGFGGRTLELNAKHPLIEVINGLLGEEEHATKVKDWVELLYDQALLTEGSKIKDPAGFASRMNALLLQVGQGLTK